MMLLQLSAAGPLYRQVYIALRDAILDGRLAAGARLPGTRSLARDLGVSRIVVLGAFDQLTAEGYLVSTVGSGTYVAVQTQGPTVPARQRKNAILADGGCLLRGAVSVYGQRARRLAAHITPNKEVESAPGAIDFRYTSSAPDAQTLRMWKQALTRATAEPEGGYPDPAGIPALRTILADYLRVQRGVVASPDDVLIVNGSQQALDLTARILCDEGVAIGIEDPQYQGTRQVLAATGARLIPCPVDSEGLNIDRYADRLNQARAIYVTPSHQFPTGAIMSIERRLKLLQWAVEGPRWVIEDDYDCEFQYGPGAIPALQGLDSNGCVIYIGTFACTLFPGLRLGYVVIPSALRDEFRSAKWLADRGSPPAEQAALGHLIRSGAYESARRRMARMLGEKRQRLLDALSSHFDPSEVNWSGSTSGSHVFLQFRKVRANQTDAFIELAAQMGVRAYNGHPYYLHAAESAALILGIATVALSQIETGVQRLAEVYEVFKRDRQFRQRTE